MRDKTFSPVKAEDIKVGEKYYTCNYTGVVMIKITKIDTNSVVGTTIINKKTVPIVRSKRFIFDNPDGAKRTGHEWEHADRKRRRLIKEQRKAKNIELKEKSKKQH